MVLDDIVPIDASFTINRAGKKMALQMPMILLSSGA